MMTVQLDDKIFWIFYLMTSFPNASDNKADSSLDEFLSEHYSVPPYQYYEQLCGREDDEGNEVDGSSFDIEINGNVTLGISFNFSETVYFLNGIYIGNTGGHYVLSLLSWDELCKITKSSKQIFMLLLPLCVGNASKRIEITKAVMENIQQMSLDFKPEDVPIITEYLVNHLIYEDDESDMFETDPMLGTICKRNHSCRKKDNPSNSPEEIIEINKLIELAMD